jgi:hypothetical protein
MLLPTAHETNPTLLILECGMTWTAVEKSKGVAKGRG